MIKVTLVRSLIGCSPKQRAVLAALGLRKIRQTKQYEDNGAIRGMLAKVFHLVEVSK